MTDRGSGIRSIADINRGDAQFEGAGFLVHRPFPTQRTSHVDPFPLFDEMGPLELGPGEDRGAPDHPHRGFETVTYLSEAPWSIEIPRETRESSLLATCDG